METVTIPRELAERLLCHAEWCVEPIKSSDLKQLRAALSAPAGPLTAEECRAFGKRVGTTHVGLVLVGEARRLQAELANFASMLDHLEEWRANNPAWTGPQPVAETTTEQKAT